MNHNDERYSLVAAYKNKRGDLVYYRLADYDQEKNMLLEADYITERFGEDYEPVTIYSKDKKDEFKTVFKKWYSDPNDPTKQRVKENDRFKGKAYEISFIEDLDENKAMNDVELREKMHNGFYVDYVINDEFLLVVGGQGNFYEVLLCNKNKFKTKSVEIEDSVYELYYLDRLETDLANSVTVLPKYKISKNDLIDLNNLMDHPFSKDIVDYNRYFYKYINLPEQSELFMVREIDDYTLSFLSKYLRSKKDEIDITTKEKMIGILEKIDIKSKEFSEFYSKLGYSLQDSEIILKNAISKYIINLEEPDEIEKIIKNVVLEDKNLYAEALKFVKLEWEKSENFEKTIAEINYELKALNDSVLEKKEEYKNISEKVSESEKTLNDYKREIAELELKESNIKEEIDKSLNVFKKDMAIFVKNEGASDTALPHKTLGKEISKDIDKGYVHKKPKYVLDLESHAKVEVEDLQDFADLLHDNIAKNFSSNSSELTANLMAALMTRKPIVISEMAGELFSSAISKLLCGYNADCYYLTTANPHVTKLLHSIKTCKSDVIYIDGVLNQFNEILFKVIQKNIRNKIVFFGVDDNLVKDFTIGMWKFASYIETDQYLSERQPVPYFTSTYDINQLFDEIKKCKEIQLNGQILDKIKDENLVGQRELDTIKLMLKAYVKGKSVQTLPPYILNYIYLQAQSKKERFFEIIKSISAENTLFIDEVGY